MIIDTSALLAVVLAEPDAARVRQGDRDLGSASNTISRLV